MRTSLNWSLLCRGRMPVKVLLVLMLAMFASLAHPKILGAIDNSSPLTPDEEQRYSNLGRIECLTSNSEIQESTGWISGSRTTIVTVAHAFFDEPTGTDIAISSCKFVLYSANGAKLDAIPIISLKSRWLDPTKPQRRMNKAHDVAIAKLQRVPTIRVEWPRILAMDEDYVDQRVTILGFRVDKGTVKVKSVGRIYRMSTHALARLGVSPSDKRRLYVGSYDSAGSQSGSMILDPDGVYGMHTGFTAHEHSRKSEFDADHYFNRGIFFDQEFADDLNMMKAL